MSDNGGSADGSTEGLSAVSVSEKGSRNKRKFLSDLSLDVPVDVSTLSLTEFPRYEMLEEKFRDALDELGSMMEMPEDTIEEQEEGGYMLADWDDPVACQLEELLTNNLLTIFCTAVKKIVECGYTEEAAEWAVLNSNLFHGSKDAVSNVVEGALALLKREKEPNTTKHPVFDGLQSLVEYTLLEMIHVLREVRPGLAITEAMWCLLISDLNLLNACVVDGGLCTTRHESLEENPTHSQSKTEASGSSKSESDTLDGSKQIIPHDKKFQLETHGTEPTHQLSNSKPNPGEFSGCCAIQEGKRMFSGISRELMQGANQGPVVDEKLGSGRKGSSSTTKRDMLRQKAFHFEKNYKGRLSKGAFKAKMAAWGSMMLDKSLKSQSGSSGVVMKGAYSKLTTAGTGCCHVEENHQPSSKLQSDVPAGMLDVKDPLFALPAANSSSSAASVTDLPYAKGETDAPDPQKATDYYASIPFDDTLKKYVPQDEKDETILMLVPHKQVLEKELRSWTNWANEKVMQATRRLGKDKAELKMLRQEKEEAEKYKKDKQSMEDSNSKRIVEMEYALANTTAQYEVANVKVKGAEEEKSMLKKELEAATLQALHSTTKLHEAMRREHEALKKLQSWDAEKGSLQELLANLKRQMTELENRLDKSRERKNQFQVLWKQEEKERLKAVKQIEVLRTQRQEDDYLKKSEEESIKQMAEKKIQKCEEEIKTLGKMIAELRLESDKLKIAALSAGYSNVPMAPAPGVQVQPTKSSFGGGGVKPERECIMCMTEEISVVFVPCAHQVLCTECSTRLENQGFNDCPSCRTNIKKRILVTYRAS